MTVLIRKMSDQKHSLIPVVSEKDRAIRLLPWGDGSSSSRLEWDRRRGRVRVTLDAQDEGYSLLEDWFDKSDDPEQRENGFDLYMDYVRACEAGKVEREKGTTERQAGEDNPDSKGVRWYQKEFPKEWLPEGVVKLMEGKAETQLPYVVPPKPKAKKGKNANHAGQGANAQAD